MRSRFSGRRLSVVFGITIAGLALAGSFAYASIPDANGVITGCYSANGSKQKNGTPLNIVDSGSTCSNGQTAIPWSQTGPAGAVGQTGPTGPAGPSDLWDFNRYGITSTLGTGHQNTIMSLELPAGSYFVEGNFIASGITAGAQFLCYLNAPFTVAFTRSDTLTGSQWTNLHVQAAITLSGQTTVYVSCTTNVDDSIASDAQMNAIKVTTVH